MKLFSNPTPFHHLVQPRHHLWDQYRHCLPGLLASTLLPHRLISPWWLESDSFFPSPECAVAPFSIRVKARVLPLATRSKAAGLAALTSSPSPLAPLRPSQSSSNKSDTLLPQGLYTGCDFAWDHFHQDAQISLTSFRSQLKCHTRPHALSSSPAIRSLYFVLSSVKSMYSK